MKKIILFLILFSSVYISAQDGTKPAAKIKDSVDPHSSKSGAIEFTEWTIKNNKILPVFEKTNFKFGIEILKTDPKDNEIIMRQRVYPCEKIKSEANYGYAQYIYLAQIITPFTVYNLVKKELADKSELFNKICIFSEITLVPLKVEGDKYTFQIVYSTKFGKYGKTFTYHDIKLSLGESIKLESAQTVDWSDSDTVDGKKLSIDSNNDYYNFIKEYLIISLDNIE